MKSFLLSSFLLISITIQAQFSQKKGVYSKWEGIEGRWDKMYQYKIILDTAYYQNGDIIYLRKIVDNNGFFLKFYPNGQIHIEGKNISVNNGKFIPTTGDWKFYYDRGTLMKEISFANWKRTGQYREMNLQGNVIKEKFYPNKFQFGAGISVFYGTLTGILDNQIRVQSDYGYGFDIGFLIKYKIDEKYSLRTFITTSFQEYGMTFSSIDNQLLIDYLMLKVPVVLSYNFLNNYNIYGGIGSNIKSRTIENTETSIFDLSLEVGVSYDINFKSFTLAPEISYSSQLTNQNLDITQPLNIHSLKRSQFYVTILIK